jgi:hypothetical protein
MVLEALHDSRVRSVAIVTLYGKPGCHLCDHARAEIERVRDEHPFDLQEIDITIDAALNRRYGERIPVLALDGEELFELHVDGDALREALGRVASARPGRVHAKRLE